MTDEEWGAVMDRAGQEFRCSVCEEMVSRIYESITPGVCLECIEEENDE